MTRRWTAGIVFAVMSLGAGLANANPHTLPYSYPYATLGTGQLEVEQYTDLTPVPAYDSSGNAAMFPRAMLTTELEYGITNRLELGLYFAATIDTGASTGSVPLRFDGIKQRLRYRFADPGELPVDVSIYGEVAELSSEVELEAKLNFEKRVGRLQFLVNLWAEREFYYAGIQEWVLNPTAGGSFEITPAIHLGLEYWLHAEYGGTINANNPPGVAAPFNPAPHSYLGPALLIEGDRFWVAVAPYLRLDDWGRRAQLGDQYGRLWIRCIIGIER